MHSDVNEQKPAADALGRAHDAADAARLEALDEAEGVRAGRSFWRELPILVVAALVLAVLLKTFVVQAFYIPSSSMAETLQINDRVVVSKLSYRLGQIERGDIIVFDDPARTGSPDESFVESVVRNLAEAVGLSTPESEFIKRVVALPGETIEIRDGAVLIDGVRLREPYLRAGRFSGDYGPEVIPKDHVFVMGDNRAVSRDSRIFGPIPVDDIVGRAFSVIWPPGNWRGL